MAESARRVDLRLTIPAAGPYYQVAGELAGKFASHAGADAGEAEQLSRRVEAMSRKLAAAAPNGSIALTMEARGTTLIVVGESNSRKEQATCPLPD